MYLHPDFHLSQFHQRERELVAEADRYRLLIAARRRRRGGARGSARAAVRGRPDGTLIACAPPAEAPAP
ncbi:MAG TPA: hypothetical protein VFT95_20295 [Micromonosporaceae bacterium]|nr:hypothetical protein [Micromonosporaceae bacterium]